MRLDRIKEENRIYYHLELNEVIILKVKAREYYSKHALKIEPNEQYNFEVLKGRKWIDFFIRSGPCGFNNRLVKDSDLRLPEANCFAVCATLGKNESDHFALCKKSNGCDCKHTHDITQSGKLYFFANDKKGSLFANLNNWGHLNVRVQRLK